MAPVSVGTAFVQIRAITSQIASDIERGLGDFDTDKLSKKLGKQLGDGIGDETSKHLKKGLTDGLADATEDAGESSAVDKAVGKSSKSWWSSFSKHFQRNSEDVDIDTDPISTRFWGSLSDSLKRDPHRHMEIETDVDIDTDPIASRFWSRLSASFAGGSDIGGGVGKSLSGFMENIAGALKMPGGFMGWAVTLGLPLLQSVVNGAVALLGGVVAALGYVATAAAGAGVGLLGFAATVAPIGGLLLAAFKTPGPQLDKFKEDMKGAVAPFEEIGHTVQTDFLPAIVKAVGALQKFIDPLKDYAVAMGDILTTTVDHASAILDSEEAMSAFNKILEESLKVGDSLGQAFGYFLEALIPILEAAAPLGAKLADSLEAMALGFKNFVDAKGVAGLTETFDKWYGRFETIMGILGDLAIIIWDIFSIGADSADGFFGKMDTGIGKWREWVEGPGAEKIKAFFDGAIPVMEEFFGLLGDIVKLFVDEDTFSGETGGMLDFMQMIRDDVIPVIDRLLTTLKESGLGEALGSLALAFVDLITMATDSGFLPLFFDAMARSLQAIADVLAIPAIQEGLAALAPALGALLIVTKIPGGMEALSWAIELLGGAIGGLVGVLGELALGMFGVEVAAGSLGAIAAGGGVLILLAAAVLGVWYAVEHWEEIQVIVGDATQAFQDFVSNFDLSNVMDDINQFADSIDFTGLQELITGFGELAGPMVDEFAETFADAIVAWYGEVPNLFFDAVDVIVRELPGVFEDLFEGIVTILGTFAPKLGKTLGVLLGTMIRLIIIGLWRLFTNLPRIFGSVIDAIETFFRRAPSVIIRGAWALVRVFGTILWNLPRIILIILNTLAQFFLGVLEGLIPGSVEWLGKLVDTIVEFFTGLPGQVLDIVEGWVDDVIGFFQDLFDELVGNSIIPDLIDSIVEFFTGLPGRVLGIIEGFITDIIDFFSELPVKILEAVTAVSQTIIDLGGKIIGWIVDGLVTLGTTLWDWFTALPQAIIDTLVVAAQALIDIGGKIIGWIVEGLTTLGFTLWDWFTALPQAALDLVVAAAQAIIDIGTKIIGWILSGITTTVTDLWNWFTKMPKAALDKVVAMSRSIVDIGKKTIAWILSGISQTVSTLWTWFSGLPRALWNLVSLGASKIVDIGSDIIGWILSGITGAASSLFSWFSGIGRTIWNAVSIQSGKFVDIGEDIIDWILDGLSGLAGDLLSFITDAMPSISSITSMFTNVVSSAWDAVPKPDVSSLDPRNWHLAMGGIVTGPTRALIGEAGAEAVIPLTRPTRAMAIMQAAGLDQMVLSSLPSGGGAVAPALGPTNLVHIENATFNEPTDVDLLVAQIRLAYASMGGSS